MSGPQERMHEGGVAGEPHGLAPPTRPMRRPSRPSRPSRALTLLVRAGLVLIAPLITIIWMVQGIQSSRSSTAAIGYIFMPIYAAFAGAVALGVVALVEWLGRRVPPIIRWPTLACVLALAAILPPMWMKRNQEAQRQQQLNAVQALTSTSPQMRTVWTVPGSFQSVAVDSAGGVIFAATPGALIKAFDARGQPAGQWRLAAAGNVGEILAAPLASGGSIGFVSYAGVWSQSLSGYDRSGAMAWTVATPTGIDNVALADLDGDGLGEVIVGCNGSGGVMVLNGDGSARWTNRTIGNVWSVCSGDFDGDGAADVITTAADGQVHVFDTSGSQRQTLSPTMASAAHVYAGSIALARGSETDPAIRYVVTGPLHGGGTFVALDAAGRSRWSLNIPNASQKGRVVLAAATTQPWLAVTTGDGTIYVIDSASGQLIGSNRETHVAKLAWLEGPNAAPLLISTTGQELRAQAVPVHTQGQR